MSIGIHRIDMQYAMIRNKSIRVSFFNNNKTFCLATPVTVCPADYCKNNGQCTFDYTLNRLRCACPGTFSGQYCEIPIGKSPKLSLTAISTLKRSIKRMRKYALL